MTAEIDWAKEKGAEGAEGGEAKNYLLFGRMDMPGLGKTKWWV